MAIDNLYFGVMCKVIDMARCDQPNSKNNIKVGCLSYPDLLVTREQIATRYPHLVDATYAMRLDSEKIRQWHSMQHLTEIIETTDFFEKLGCETDYFDFAEIRGGEIITDLNMPLNSEHHGRYDIVIDTGTLEHCFNVGIAFENMCRLARIGGLIISSAPMSKVNHGFWNFSPCAYDNYYRQNQFDLLFLGAFHKDKEGLKQITISPNGRQIAPPESFLISVAKRTENSTFKLPIQKKYM
jgi:hypothetical protein